jgi:hypothetical protein
MMVQKKDKIKAKGKPTSTTMSPGQQSTKPHQRGQQPEWAKGLRRLYNSVVEEPLPDSFADLIAKLDADDA